MASLPVMGVALHVTEVYGNANVQSLDDFKRVFLSSWFHGYSTRFRLYLGNGTRNREASSATMFAEDQAIAWY